MANKKESRLTGRSDGARVRQVIEVMTWIGNGSDESPYRSIREYWSLQGQLLAIREEAPTDDADLASFDLLL